VPSGGIWPRISDQGVLTNCKAMPFASRDSSRKARQRAGILGEAIPLCRNAAAASLSREPFGLKLEKRGAALSSRAKARRALALDSALLGAFPAISGMAFQFVNTP
jgi:hypothetical protein